jgi:hypothetical protein
MLAISIGTAYGGEETASGKVTVDHLVYAAPDLQAESDRLTNQLGVSVTPGGSHPGRGTANALISLGANQYLEIIGPDPKLSAPKGAGAKIAKLSKPEILTFAVQDNQLESIETRAKTLGLKTSGIRPGSRRTDAGDLLQWRTLGIAAGEEYGGLIPFFIDWGETPHPSATSGQSAHLVGMVVEHPQPERLSKLYRDLGVNVPVRYGKQPSIVVEIESGSNKVSIRGTGRGL